MIAQRGRGEAVAGLRRRPAGPRLALRRGPLPGDWRRLVARHPGRSLQHRRRLRTVQHRRGPRRSAAWSTSCGPTCRTFLAQSLITLRHRPPGPRPPLRHRRQPRSAANSAGGRGRTSPPGCGGRSNGISSTATGSSGSPPANTAASGSGWERLAGEQFVGWVQTAQRRSPTMIRRKQWWGCDRSRS